MYCLVTVLCPVLRSVSGFRSRSRNRRSRSHKRSRSRSRTRSRRSRSRYVQCLRPATRCTVQVRSGTVLPLLFLQDRTLNECSSQKYKGTDPFMSMSCNYCTHLSISLLKKITCVLVSGMRSYSGGWNIVLCPNSPLTVSCIC